MEYFVIWNYLVIQGKGKSMNIVHVEIKEHTLIHKEFFMNNLDIAKEFVFKQHERHMKNLLKYPDGSYYEPQNFEAIISTTKFNDKGILKKDIAVITIQNDQINEKGK